MSRLNQLIEELTEARKPRGHKAVVNEIFRTMGSSLARISAGASTGFKRYEIKGSDPGYVLQMGVHGSIDAEEAVGVAVAKMKGLGFTPEGRGQYGGGMSSGNFSRFLSRDDGTRAWIEHKSGFGKDSVLTITVKPSHQGESIDEASLGLDYYLPQYKKLYSEFGELDRKKKLAQKRDGMDWAYVNRRLRDRWSTVVDRLRTFGIMIKRLGGELPAPIPKERGL